MSVIQAKLIDAFEAVLRAGFDRASIFETDPWFEPFWGRPSEPWFGPRSASYWRKYRRRWVS